MTDSNLPLSNYKVLDLSIARAGPSAVRLLADWGADIIRIEPPHSGDIAGDRYGPDSQNLHRNKRSLCLDLKTTAGRDVFLRLAADADILVENFRVGVTSRLGIDYQTVREINPTIIYASISGFGQDGPYASRPAVDQVVQGMSGLMSITGRPGDGPMRVGIAVSDTSAGMFLGQGILLALLHRERTGEGQWVHTSLLESMLCMLDFQAARYTMSREVASQEGNNHPTLSPMGVFDASDGQVNLAASTDRMFRAFCEAMSANDLLSDSRFATVEGRLVHREALWQTINSITRNFTSTELVSILNAAGIPCGPINGIDEAFEDEQVRHLKMTRIACHQLMGDLALIRSPINMTEFEQGEDFVRAGPEAGEHSREILREHGYSQDDIDLLAESGAIRCFSRISNKQPD